MTKSIVYKLGRIATIENSNIDIIVGFYNCENGISDIHDDEFIDECFKYEISKHFKNHPSPYCDGFKNFSSGFHACACDSIVMLKNWFQGQVGTDILDILILNGCKLYSFETEIVFSGKSQVCYKIENVHNVQELNTEILFKN